MVKQVRGLAAALAVAAAIVAGPAWADAFADAFAIYVGGDHARAFKLMKPLAEGGELRAQYMLGRMYSEGEGTPENDAEAAKWYLAAAERGDGVSQLILGSMYVNGQGVGRDYVAAYKWLAIVVASGKDGYADQAREVLDLITQLMGAEDLLAAQKQARDWKPKG